MQIGGKRIRTLRIVAMSLAVFSIFSLVAVDFAEAGRLKRSGGGGSSGARVGVFET